MNTTEALSANLREDDHAPPLNGTGAPGGDSPQGGPAKNGRPRPGKDPRSRDPERNAAFLKSMLAAFSRRAAATAPDLGLEELTARRAEIDRYLDHQVAALRRHGFSWADIGGLAGMEAQSAWEHWAWLDKHTCPACPGCEADSHTCPACGQVQHHGGA